MPLSLREQHGVTELARVLCDFLPGTAHPWADQSLSFPGAAQAAGLDGFYPGGSKEPAIAQMLTRTLEERRDRFCRLIEEIVRRSLTYRSGTQSREELTRRDVEKLNTAVEKVGFKIPELWDPAFLDSLPRTPGSSTPPASSPQDFGKLRSEFTRIQSLAAQPRGYAFEKFLALAFDAFGLRGRRPFRLVGEQIDGSFELDSETYLVEAKWQDALTVNRDLQAFRGSVESKAAWSRGLFVSYTGFSKDGLARFSRGYATNLVGMTGFDIHMMLAEEIPLDALVRRKVRWAAETGEFWVPITDLGLG